MKTSQQNCRYIYPTQNPHIWCILAWFPTEMKARQTTLTVRSFRISNSQAERRPYGGFVDGCTGWIHIQRNAWGQVTRHHVLLAHIIINASIHTRPNAVWIIWKVSLKYPSLLPGRHSAYSWPSWRLRELLSLNHVYRVRNDAEYCWKQRWCLRNDCCSGEARSGMCCLWSWAGN